MNENPLQKQVREITDKLEQGIEKLFESKRYMEYLTAMSKFYNYSINNTILIAMQKPDATLIAGYNAWKNLHGRQVMKGEKAIKILAPAPYKIETERSKINPQTGKPELDVQGNPIKIKVEIKIPAYKVVNVFDVSQTEGKEIPTIGLKELSSNVEKYQEFFKAVESVSPVPVGFENIKSGAHGYYHLGEKRIAIDQGMSELQNLKTLIHEISHAKLHDTDAKMSQGQTGTSVLDRSTKEVQAESIAYVICQHYGLDTSEYSFGYIAGWSNGREMTELKNSLEVIRNTAAELISNIDENLSELQKTREVVKDQKEFKTTLHIKDEKREKSQTTSDKKLSVLDNLHKKQEQIKENKEVAIGNLSLEKNREGER